MYTCTYQELAELEEASTAKIRHLEAEVVRLRGSLDADADALQDSISELTEALEVAEQKLLQVVC
jgi:LPS O-antigen subunit length determinant protein (WzzB/FepE family)